MLYVQLYPSMAGKNLSEEGETQCSTAFIWLEQAEMAGYNLMSNLPLLRQPVPQVTLYVE